MGEIWKKVNGVENYEVSNTGKVKRLDTIVTRSDGQSYVLLGRILKQENLKRGYKRITFCNNNITSRMSVHRIVAINFIDNPDNKPCVNHIDGNTSNNTVENLEWCTYSENEKHSYSILNKLNNNRKLNSEDVLNIKNSACFGVNGNIKDLAFTYSVDVSTIYNILKNKYYV